MQVKAEPGAFLKDEVGGDRRRRFGKKVAMLMEAVYLTEEVINEMVKWMQANGAAGEMAVLIEEQMLAYNELQEVNLRNECFERTWRILGQALLTLGKEWRYAFFRKYAPGGHDEKYATDFGYIKNLGKYLPEGIEKERILAQLEAKNAMPASIISSLRDGTETGVSRALLAEFDGDIEYFFNLTDREMKDQNIWEYPVVTEAMLDQARTAKQPSMPTAPPPVRPQPIPLIEQVAIAKKRGDIPVVRHDLVEHVQARPAKPSLAKIPSITAMTSMLRSRKMQTQQRQVNQIDAAAAPSTKAGKRKQHIITGGSSKADELTLSSEDDDVAIVGSAPSVLPQKKKKRLRKLDFKNTKNDAICLD